MTLNDFLTRSDFARQTELRRTLLLAFYELRSHETAAMTVAEVASKLAQLGFPRPNTSRLSAAIKRSRMFVSAGPQAFKIHPVTVETLVAEFPEVGRKTEDVVHHDSVVAESLLHEKRAFISSLIRQINASYENNIFDGCAVLMRRLIEILLILAYQANHIESTIQDSDGAFKQLNSIIDDAKTNKTLAFSRNTKESLEKFRKLGNFSAHKIYYNAVRRSIEEEILDFRAVVEELLYKANLRR